MIEFCSTKNPALRVSLKEAVLSNMPADKGLYMPVSIPLLPPDFFKRFHQAPFSEVAHDVLSVLLEGALERDRLASICSLSFTFDAPLKKLRDNLYCLELFHGPTMAFKDFGVRFMAELLSVYEGRNADPLTVLTATSGDTGAAVASAFYNRPGFEVCVLFPRGKVSKVQELQIASLGGNIKAIEVNGTFDDCQKLVKQLLDDDEIRKNRRFASANSINIARLLPQVCYFLYACAQLQDRTQVVVSVPSGNFGNLTAGIIAKRLGAPIKFFAAATNENDVVPRYLNCGIYEERPFRETLSSAMDIASPNNFARIESLTENSLELLRKEVKGVRFSDAETIEGMKTLYRDYGYVSEPHGAIGYLGVDRVSKPGDTAIFIETAHPIKFKEIVENALQCTLPIPPEITDLLKRSSLAERVSNDYRQLKKKILD